MRNSEIGMRKGLASSMTSRGKALELQGIDSGFFSRKLGFGSLEIRGVWFLGSSDFGK